MEIEIFCCPRIHFGGEVFVQAFFALEFWDLVSGLGLAGRGEVAGIF